MPAEYFSLLRPFSCNMNRIGEAVCIGFGHQINKHGRSIIYDRPLSEYDRDHFDFQLIAIGDDVKFWARL